MGTEITNGEAFWKNVGRLLAIVAVIIGGFIGIEARINDSECRLEELITAEAEVRERADGNTERRITGRLDRLESKIDRLLLEKGLQP